MCWKMENNHVSTSYTSITQDLSHVLLHQCQRKSIFALELLTSHTSHLLLFFSLGFSVAGDGCENIYV